MTQAPANPQTPTLRDAGDKSLAAITVASRIPEFWADQTRLWFVQFEAVVDSQKLSDAAKLNLVVRLGKSAIQQVSDLLLAPPESRRYETLKDRLLEVFEETETRKLQKLIGEMELGDQRPSQLLRRMRELAREKVGDETLKLMWQSHLPTAVRAILTVTDSKSLDVLAAVADKVMESTGERSTQLAEVKAASHSDGSGARTADTQTIMGELAKINLRLKELESSSRSRPTERYRRDQRPRSTSRRGNSTAKRQHANWLCFYHFRYREKAKCVKPCNWSGPQAEPSGN